MNASRKSQMLVRIDHLTESVVFGTTNGMITSDADTASGVAEIDTPMVQTMPSDQLRNHMEQMYLSLHDAVHNMDNSWKTV